MSIDPAAMMAEIMGRLTGPGGRFSLVETPGHAAPGFVGAVRNLGEVLASSVSYGDRDYIVTATERLSYAQHAERVAALAAALREDYGVEPGDRIAINAANFPDWIVSFWAAVAVGAITVGYNAWWAPMEIEYALGHTEPKLVIADAKRAALTGDRAPLLLTLEEDVPAAVERHRGAELRVHDAAPEDPAIILYTSGTSGRPKGAVHSHRNLASVIEYHRLNDAVMVEAAAQWGVTIDPADRRYLLALPLFHIASLHNLAVPRLATGSTVVMHQGAFDVEAVLGLVEKEKVTNWGAVPTMAHRILEYGDVSKFDLSSLTAFSLASAPSSPAFKDRLRKAFPPARDALVDSYGLTESSTAIAVASPMDIEQFPGTLGRPITGVRLEIRDSEGRVLPEGEEGEICVLSPYVMSGYWRNEAATAEAIDPNGWLRTGDIGTVEGGRLRLTTPSPGSPPPRSSWRSSPASGWPTSRSRPGGSSPPPRCRATPPARSSAARSRRPSASPTPDAPVPGGGLQSASRTRQSTRRCRWRRNLATASGSSGPATRPVSSRRPPRMKFCTDQKSSCRTSVASSSGRKTSLVRRRASVSWGTAYRCSTERSAASFIRRCIHRPASCGRRRKWSRVESTRRWTPAASGV